MSSRLRLIIGTVLLCFVVASCVSVRVTEQETDAPPVESTAHNTETTASDTESTTGVEMNQGDVVQPETETQTDGVTLPDDTSQTETVNEEEEDMIKVNIKVGDQTFLATLYDNATVEALLELLPMTLNMSELNGNEKYYYLDSSLPTDASRPSGIKAGDLMLFGNSCLVLFYESFSTSYSYTPLGHIDDPQGLAAALGNGSVQVKFER